MTYDLQGGFRDKKISVRGGMILYRHVFWKVIERFGAGTVWADELKFGIKDE